MRREHLEHLIRASSSLTNEYEIVVVGSQSILGAYPNAPETLLESMEADLYPLNRPDLADVIDGAIGEMSPFERMFGYYAQGVGPETAVLPEGWRARLVKIQNRQTDFRIGYCLEPHDLAASKLAAGREKDWNFVAIMIREGLADIQTLLERIAALPLPAEHRARLERWVQSRETPQARSDESAESGNQETRPQEPE
jgi:hypothetical protein